MPRRLACSTGGWSSGHQNHKAVDTNTQCSGSFQDALPWGDINSIYPLLNQVPLTNQSNHRGGPIGADIQSMGVRFPVGARVTPKQPPWKVFSQRGWMMVPHSCIKLTSPSLCTLIPTTHAGNMPLGQNCMHTVERSVWGLRWRSGDLPHSLL